MGSGERTACLMEELALLTPDPDCIWSWVGVRLPDRSSSRLPSDAVLYEPKVLTLVEIFGGRLRRGVCSDAASLSSCPIMDSNRGGCPRVSVGDAELDSCSRDVLSGAILKECKRLSCTGVVVHVCEALWRNQSHNSLASTPPQQQLAMIQVPSRDCTPTTRG